MTSRATLRLLWDIAERAGATFVQEFLSFFIAALAIGQAADLSLLNRAALAGIAAVLAMLKGWVASKMGSKQTASLLPARLETPFYDWPIDGDETPEPAA